MLIIAKFTECGRDREIVSCGGAERCGAGFFGCGECVGRGAGKVKSAYRVGYESHGYGRAREILGRQVRGLGRMWYNKRCSAIVVMRSGIFDIGWR